MKYMVMECHLSYAVVLDEEGRFLKVANRHYEVGQTVTDIIEMKIPESAPPKQKISRKIYSAAAIAACLLLAVTTLFRVNQVTYASVYMHINPEIRIDVNRKDLVVGLDGVNTDGRNLIDGYSYQKKNLNLVMEELIDRAIEMDFLHEGGKITLTLDSKSNQWIVEHDVSLSSGLQEHLNEKLSVSIDVTNIKEANRTEEKKTDNRNESDSDADDSDEDVSDTDDRDEKDSDADDGDEDINSDADDRNEKDSDADDCDEDDSDADDRDEDDSDADDDDADDGDDNIGKDN